jgi:trk system potassium uptake protein TrkH
LNLEMVSKSLGMLLIIEALSILPSIGVALLYNEMSSLISFLYTIGILLVLGIAMSLKKPHITNIYPREGFAIVGLGWVLVSFFGALPFYFSNSIPSFVDSIFESVSGFTTTGASILTNIEGLSKSILFWRSFTHWVGGMGVLVLTLAILPSVSAGAFQIMHAESPGPKPSRLVPKVGQTAKILYCIYLIITIVQIILLRIFGMPLYDAFVHTFGTLGTGGFSSRNASVAAYNNISIEITITVFMIAAGTNFSLYYHALKGGIKEFFKDAEFRFYIFVILLSILFITIDIKGQIYGTVTEALRHASFQVASVITTTGYVTANFDAWPFFSKLVLLSLMLIGGCAGSTGGAIKHVRILALLKIARSNILKILHPKALITVKIGNKRIDEEDCEHVLVFFFLYILIFVIATLLVSLDGKDFATTVSSVIATLGNIGPGLGEVGPVGNYSNMSVISKMVLSLCMLIGRLEIYPILLLVVPAFWRRANI